MGYATIERVVVVEKKFEKTFENPLTNHPECGTIRRSSRGEQKNNWVVTYHEKWRLILWLTR